MSVDWSQVGSKIRLARKQNGLTQEQLAGKELTKGFISLVESGKARPSRRSLLIICDRLGLSLDDILGEEAGPEELLEVAVAQSKALLKSSNTAEAVRKLRDALSIAERLPPDRWTGIVLKELGIAHVLRGAPDEGFQLLTESLPHLKSKEQSIHLAEAVLYMGNVYSDRHQLFPSIGVFSPELSSAKLHG